MSKKLYSLGAVMRLLQLRYNDILSSKEEQALEGQLDQIRIDMESGN